MIVELLRLQTVSPNWPFIRQPRVAAGVRLQSFKDHREKLKRREAFSSLPSEQNFEIPAAALAAFTNLYGFLYDGCKL